MKGSEKENPFILAAQKAGIMVEYLKRETRSVQENSPYRCFIRERAKTIRERKTPEVLYYSFLRCLPRTSDGRSGGKRRRRGPGGGRAVPDFKGGAPRLEKFNERGISEPHTAADQPDFLRVAGTVRPSAPGAAGAASCLQKPYLRNTGGWSRDSTAEA